MTDRNPWVYDCNYYSTGDYYCTVTERRTRNFNEFENNSVGHRCNVVVKPNPSWIIQKNSLVGLSIGSFAKPIFRYSAK